MAARAYYEGVNTTTKRFVKGNIVQTFVFLSNGLVSVSAGDVNAAWKPVRHVDRYEAHAMIKSLIDICGYERVVEEAA